MYQANGRDVGPVSFSELQELAATGVLLADSEVRSLSSFSWQRASHVEGLAFTSSQDASNDQDLKFARDSDLMTKVVDQWYCQVGGLELGPLTFDELLDLAKTQQITADDDVRLGAGSKWRRAGSIGRLMAAMPYQNPEFTKAASAPKANSSRPLPRHNQIDAATVEAAALVESFLIESDRAEPVPVKVTSAKPVPAVDSQVAFQMAFQQARQAIAASILSQADAAFKAAEATAKSEIAWASAPNVDKHWWGWMGNVEFGPIEFPQVFALARNGQLKPTDFIRNGAFGQFVPSSTLPGLFNAVAMIAKASETLALAQSQAKAAVDAADAVPIVPPTIEVQPAIEISMPHSVKSPPKVLAHAEEFETTDFDPVEMSPTSVTRSRTRPRQDSLVAAVGLQAESDGPGLVSTLKDAVTGEYGAHLVALMLAVAFLGYWYFPRRPVRPLAVHPVKGRVVIDGEPLANAVVSLHHVGHGKSKFPAHLHPHGKAIQDGTFALETFDPADGAPEGEFIATVFLVEEKIDADGDKSYGPNLLPPVYSKPETSPFKLKITASTKELEPLQLKRQ